MPNAGYLDNANPNEKEHLIVRPLLLIPRRQADRAACLPASPICRFSFSQIVIADFCPDQLMLSVG